MRPCLGHVVPAEQEPVLRLRYLAYDVEDQYRLDFPVHIARGTLASGCGSHLTCFARALVAPKTHRHHRAIV